MKTILKFGFTSTLPLSMAMFITLWNPAFAWAFQADSALINKLMILNDSIDWAIQNDVTRGFEYETKLERFAAQIGEDRELGSGFLKMGKVYAITGDRERARNYYGRAHDQFEQAGEKGNAALATIYVGMSYSDDGAYEEALKTFQVALDLYREMGNIKYEGHVYSHMAYANSQMGNIVGGLTFNLKALDAFEQVGDSADAAIEMSNIAESYAGMGELHKAMAYYKRSALILRDANFTVNLMGALIGLGETYLEFGDLDQAKFYFDSTYSYAQSFSNTKYMAFGATGLGKIFQAQGEFSGALEKFQEAISLFESVNERVSIIDVYCLAADRLIQLGKLDEALPYLEKAVKLSAEMDSRVPYMTYLKSAESLDSARGDLGSAYWKLKEHYSIRDSLFNMKNAHRLAGLQFRYEEEKQALIERAEMERKEQRERLIRNAILAALIGSILFGIIIFRQRNRIAAARKRSDELLLNILPKEVALELKEKGHAEAQLIDHVTVLFTDFKGFTLMAEQMSAKELVSDLNVCFSEFDRIIEKYDIEKIKTIGDAYMAAGGIPLPDELHAEHVIRAAFEMRDFVETQKASKIEAGLPYFEIRIGVHTGPVVAGIVGVKKFQYDIWGDTVNTASRLESSGEVGQVNISETTYNLLKDNPNFKFNHRGKIEAKGKGDMSMYFVSKA